MSVDAGLSAWRSSKNHNRMITRQHETLETSGNVEIAYFGGSAFRITTPAGLSVMVDPWRNLPTGQSDWFFHDFPHADVDIGLSTHAHFDHDALHCLDANTLIDRPIGNYEFCDLKIRGIADKHATDISCALYDMHRVNSYFRGRKILPPENARSWDNCLIVIETGGLKILHWGDNRHNPPEEVWQLLEGVDILIVPVDDSEHVLGFGMVQEIVERLVPRVVIPNHYLIWNIIRSQSTLLTADRWLRKQKRVENLSSALKTYNPSSLPAKTSIHSFGEHVAFDVDAWHERNGLAVDPEGGC